QEIRLDKRRNHSIEAVVDRLLIKSGINERMGESIRTALKLTNGAVLVSVIDGEEKLYSEKMACVNCGINIPPLEPRSFSFNSSFGACRRCQGIGTVMEMDASKIIPDTSARVDKIDFLNGVDNAGGNYLKTALVAVIEKLTVGDPIDPEAGKPSKGKLRKLKDAIFGSDPSACMKVPYKDLPQEIRDAFMNGTKRRLTFRHGDYKFEREWKG